MARKRQVSRVVPVHRSTARPAHVVKVMSTSTRSSSPPPMLRPGTADLPEPPESTVPLAAVAHSMQLDTRRKFVATYEDITQYMDKCEYLFDHDEFYDKSYKSLAKTVGELNRIGTDAQQQEREQLYNSLLDWLNTSVFTLEAPTYGVINEHQLIESGQITRDLLVRMLLGLERLRALHISIIDKVRSAAELTPKKTDKAENKRQLLKMVDDSSFVWKTAAAEIVQLLHEERSKGGELVELYADKIRYLMGELEAQSNMIEELRIQLDQQPPLPFKLQEKETKTKRAKPEVTSRQAKQTGGSQQGTSSDDIDEDDLRTAVAAISTLPDFNKQLMTTLQKELEECRRQQASMVARGHEAAAKIRFLTEENNRKDKQIAQLQANVVKLKSETRVAEADSQDSVTDDSRRKDSDGHQRKQTGRRSTGKTRRGRAIDSIQLQDTEEEDDDTTASRMKLRQIIAAAKRQKQPSQPSHRPAAGDASPVLSTSQPAGQSPDAAVAGASRTDTRRIAPSTAPTKPGKPRLRGGRGKMDVTERVATAAATIDKQEQSTVSVPQAPTFQQMSGFWQQSAVKDWTPVETSVDTRNTAHDVKTAAQPAPQQTDVDMNEAIEMTKLFLAGPKIQQKQPTTPVKARHEQQRRPVGEPSATHTATTIRPQLFAESSAIKAPTADRFHQQQQQQATTSSTRPPVTSGETLESVSSRQHRAKTPAEAAKLRAARLSAVLFHSVDGPSHTPVVPPPLTAAFSQQQQQQKQKQNVETTKSKPRAKAGYDLVGVNMHNLAQQAKLLENDSVSKTPQRFN